MEGFKDIKEKILNIYLPLRYITSEPSYPLPPKKSIYARSGRDKIGISLNTPKGVHIIYKNMHWAAGGGGGLFPGTNWETDFFFQKNVGDCT